MDAILGIAGYQISTKPSKQVECLGPLSLFRQNEIKGNSFGFATLPKLL
jgi:hypothetical protein